MKTNGTIFVAQPPLRPIPLECGKEIGSIPVGLQHYGRLSTEKNNAILICHAFSGDQFVAGPNPNTGRGAWWPKFVGSGRENSAVVIDTDRYFVICANILGGCSGTLGPSSINSETGKPYGPDFPIITISDMVKIQKSVIDFFGIRKLHCVIGGSMGGMQVLEWMRQYPDNINSAMAIATSFHNSPQNVAFNAVGRQAIMDDPHWCDGRYIESGKFPSKGLALARMMAHITYMSPLALAEKFGRQTVSGDSLSFSLTQEFQIERYLGHQGQSFVDRFDPNSYIYISRAMDYFDLMKAGGGYISRAFRHLEEKPIFVAAFSTDWLFPPTESGLLAAGLREAGADVTEAVFTSIRGHDAFLLDEPQFFAAAKAFLGQIQTSK